jgi:hypothetical protein
MLNIFKENGVEVGSSHGEFLQSGNQSKLKYKLREPKATGTPH